MYTSRATAECNKYIHESESVSCSVMSDCDPMDCSSPSGSSVHGIPLARILEWVAIPYSGGSSWPRDRTQVSCTAGRFFTVWVTREGLSFSPCSAFSPQYLAHSLLLRSSINTCWKSGKMKALQKEMQDMRCLLAPDLESDGRKLT